MDKKIILEKLQRIFSFKGYGVSDIEIQKRVIDSTYFFHLGGMILLVFLESYVLTTNIIKYGFDASGIYLYRRCLYAALGILALIMAITLIYLHQKHLYKAYKKVSLFLPVIIIAWGTGMTVIDCLKGNDISVFTYTILVVAAFTTHIEFFWPAGVFVFFTALLNVLLTKIPQIEYTTGMRVNSIYACVLAFFVMLFVSYQNKSYKAMEIKNEELLSELLLTNQKLESKSEKDGLTELYNRTFLSKLEDISASPSGVIMLDADKFKVFNDTYGHTNGDLCLKYIAKKLQSIPDAEKGYSIRYGGEEFLIIYYGISKDRLMTNAETIFKNIREGSFLIDGDTEKKITVSMGVLYDKDSTLSVHEMIKHADEALYSAKEQGRDRIVEASILTYHP